MSKRVTKKYPQPQIIREKNYPAGRGKFLKIIEGLLPTPKIKTKAKGLKLLDMYPINITYYAPNDAMMLFAGHQWKKLADDDVDKLLATVVYIKALNLHQFPSFLTHFVSRPRIYIGMTEDGIRHYYDLNKNVVRMCKQLHNRTKKWIEKQWKV